MRPAPSAASQAAQQAGRSADDDSSYHNRAESKGGENSHEYGENREKKSSSSSSSYHSGALVRSPLLLVGHVDGSVDLFHMESESPVQSWNLPSFSKSSSGNSGRSGKDKMGDKIVFLQGCST